MQRSFWTEKINKLFQKFNVAWLAGVRRSGKTTLCQSLEGIEYFDCEIPRIRNMMEDPELFLKKLKNKKIVLDEIHRLADPAELLKICADHFKSTQLIATGSSTLAAKKKFRDTLTNRKANLFLTPMTLSDMHDFQNDDLEHRLLFGGLPPFFLDTKLPEADFQDWIDDYWAKDVQELFKIEKREAFIKFVELVLIRSGGQFEATAFAAPCEVSRQTIMNYLSVLEMTFVANVIRPFYKNPEKEVVSIPKVFGFDTGFVCCFKNWIQLRTDDFGLLWEHFVLNELCAHFDKRNLFYWRDKRNKYEVDFIMIPRRGSHPYAIECKWSSKAFDADSLLAFRHLHEKGQNFVVCNDVVEPFERTYKNMTVTFTSLSNLVQVLRGI